jgi:HPt (histidine-containing phosphotransfer) domain-containing protein
MSGVPPNNDIADLVTLLGEDSVRQLIRTFLREYPRLLEQLANGDRKTRHRIAHSLKSNARVIGARDLAARMADVEQRLGDANAADVGAADIAAIAAEFDAAAAPLRAFADRV